MRDDMTITDAFPPWLTVTKTLPLRHHLSLIKRAELTRRLNTGRDLKLSLLAAPAGFGKSTLLGHWRKELLDENIFVAWLSIDEDDNDPALFVIYLVYAFATAGLAEDIFDLHPTGFNPDTSFRTILSILLSAIARQDTKLVLILDDVEKLDAQAAKNILDPLLRYSPDNLHVVLSTRSTENLQLSSLKLQGQVNQITTTDLKFTPFEVEAFLGNKLTKKDLMNVNKKTEGWPVALQLIKNSLAGHSDHKKIIDKFKGTEQDTREYISEQILTDLPAAQKDLLMEVSILTQFDPDTSDLIRGTTNSHATLTDMVSLNQLVTPLEDRENTYRLHPLFREALLYHLEHADPERLKNLHLRAAEMYLDQGHVIQSIRHALLAGQPDKAADILEQAGGILLWNKEGMSRIRKAHALLPEHIISSRPRLSLLRALVLLKDGHLNDARQIYDKVRQDLNNDPQIQSAALDYDLAVITSTLAVYEGTPLTEEMSHNLVISIENFEHIDDIQIGFVYTILCVFHLQKGDFTVAINIGNKAISHFQKHHSIFGETYIYIHLGVVAMAEGKLDIAYEHYSRAQENLRRYFIEDKDLRLVLNILMAEWHYEKNDLTTAARLLGDINHRLEGGEAWYEIYAAGYSTSTALTFLQKGLGACLNLSDDAVSYIRREGLKRLNRLVMANEIGYLCRAGKVIKARKIVQENNLAFEDYTRDRGIFFSVRESYGVIQALSRLLIAEGRYDEALKELNRQIKSHQQKSEIRALQKYRLLSAIALYESSATGKAFYIFGELLHFVRTSGFLRFILDEDPFIRPLLKAYIQDGGATEKDHAQYLLDQFNEEKSPETHITLSRREKQVLQQLAEGYSDKVIARHLEVSENTVRFHLKNLFGKLDVNSRLMAVSEANKHKLLQ